MALSILNNIPSISAQNQVRISGNELQKTLFRLSSGSRINSGADDAAGLAIADGLRTNITALSQAARNANDGIGALQVADGALAQVSSLLNRAVTLATSAANGTLLANQRTSLNAEFTAIKAEIDRIGTNTNFNGTAVFSATAMGIFLSDGVANSTISVTTGALSSAGVGLTATGDLLTVANATAALTELNASVQTVASTRGAIGAGINRLQAALNVIGNQVQNLTAAEDGIRAADISQEVARLTQYQILGQTGIAALAQANQQQQQVLQLLR